jgi:hypothetical protein
MLNYSHICAANVVSYVGSLVYLSGETKAICESHILQCEKVNLEYPFLPV